MPRPLIAGFLILALLWAVALGVLALGRDPGRFPADAAVDARFSARPGVNLSPADLGPDRLDAILARLSSQGILFVRFTLPWDEIEPAQGQFAWEAWDAVADSFARQPSLQPIAVLDRSPEWARGPADKHNRLAPPHERRDFGAFASAIAERYGDRFTYYQVWDEPNIAPHWGAKPADPADYAGLLREAAIKIRAADPDARIVSAALAPTTESGGANLSDVSFLDQLYVLGGREWFDYPAGQPFGFSASPDGAPDPGRLDFRRAALLREVMERHGDAGTPLWATSFGWDASSGAAAESEFGAVTADEQATYTASAFERATREWPWLGPLLWTGKFEMAPATGIVLAAVAAPVQVLGPGRHAADSPAIVYDRWRATSEAADPSADGDTVEFSFTGTGVALEAQGGPYWAYLTAKVDGGPANRLPKDEAGASYLVLYDPGAATRLAPLADGLPAGEHTVSITAHGGWGQWPLRAVVISSNTPGLDARLGLGLLALAVIALVVVAGATVRWQRGRPRPAGRESVADGAGVEGQAGGTAVSNRFLDVAGWLLAIALCALFLVSGSGVVNFAVLAVLGMLFLLRPELAPPLIAASLPWWQRTQPVLRWQFGLFEVLAWIAVLAWATRAGWAWLMQRTVPRPAGAGGGKRPGIALALDISVVALFAGGLVATLFAEEQGVAWREFRIVFLFGLVFYLLVTRASRGTARDRASALVLGLLAGATIASLAGLWQFVTGQGRVNVEGVGRIAGFYGSPNNLALILDRAVPLAAALALFGVAFWPPPTPAAGRMRGVFAAVALITLTAAVATFSKGALLLGLPVGLGVVLLGGAWRSGKRWPLWLLLALAIAGGLGLVALFQTPRFADLFNFAGGTSFFRLKLWQGALNMALDHPLLGVGPDNFLYAYRTRYVLPSAWQELSLSHPHNLPLDLWTRMGLIGVVAGVGSLVVTVGAGWRGFVAGRVPSDEGAQGAPDTRREVREGPGGVGGTAAVPLWPLMLGLLGGLAAGVAHGMIDNSLFLPDLMGWFVAAQAIFWLNLPTIPRASRKSLNPTNPGPNPGQNRGQS